MRRFAAAWVVLAMTMATSGAAAQSKELPAVADLLARVDNYLTTFAKAYAQVVAEEHYRQEMKPSRVSMGLTSTTRRDIESDVVAVSDSTQAWLNFRDVYQVDRTSVRDRDERLAQLFLKNAGDPLAKARVIADEGARFNLGTVARNVNFPAMALTFLATDNQPRSKFRVIGRSTVGQINTVTLEFEETRRPTLIKSGTLDLPVSGKFWIEPAGGRIMKSSLHFDSKEFGGDIEVTFGFVEKLELWLPIEMKDSTWGPREIVTGRATYTNFRLFGTSVVIK